MMESFSVVTIGCRVNRAESLAMERQFYDLGVRRARDGENPDLWVVNTCAVTSEAMKKSRKAVRRCAGTGSKVIVTGCGVEFNGECFAGNNVALVKNRDKKELVSRALSGARLESGKLQWELPRRVRVPVKVQDGCSKFCSYCVVPFLRQRQMRPLDAILGDVSYYVERGAGEVVLCGIDLGKYVDAESGSGFEKMIERVMHAAHPAKVRLSSIAITDITDALLSLMSADGNLCRHLHIPLQSGDEKVLRLMKRGYSPDEYSRKLTYLREQVAEISVTSDVMVGFPGEDRSSFETTASFVSDRGFSRIHVFRYSPRAGTEAYGMGDPVSPREKKRRSRVLRGIAAESARRFHDVFVGRIIAVLVEGPLRSRPGHLFGRTESFGGVVFRGSEELVGRIVPVSIESNGNQWMEGRICRKESG